MSASMELPRGRHTKSMRQLEFKISDLQSQYQQLAKQRQQDIAHFLSWVDLSSAEDAVLIGAFLFIKDKLTTKDPIMEDWQAAGARFLRRTRSNKTIPCTQGTTAQKTNRSPQKHLAFGEE